MFSLGTNTKRIVSAKIEKLFFTRFGPITEWRVLCEEHRSLHVGQVIPRFQEV